MWSVEALKDIMINRHQLDRKLRGLRRDIYGLRRFIPGLKERHILESMVGPLGFWEELQAYQLNTLKSNGLRPEHSLLDIGCGPLQGGIAFIKYLEKNKYFGIDVDQKSIEAGINQIKKLNLSYKNPFLSLSNTFGREELKDIKFRFIWASQILYYFNDDTLKNLMEWVSSALLEEGKFLGDIISPKHYEFRTREHNWNLHTTNSLSSLSNQFNLKIQNLGEVLNYSYPEKLSLRFNNLIEITKN